jgi:pyruvate/2-oxoglutarate dehydrogenase complex dihydrolipoamide dehydrogenase (E3) component
MKNQRYQRWLNKRCKKYMTIVINHKVQKVEKITGNKKRLIAVNKSNGKEVEVITEEILVAEGISLNMDILRP